MKEPPAADERRTRQPEGALSRRTVRPNFLIIGAPKCATTTICYGLQQHPDIFMATPKELYFFSHDDRYCERGWSWYSSHFEQGRGCKAIGEASPTYTVSAVHPNAAKRIAQDLPDAKLIYMVRHPLARIESHWRQLIFNRESPPPMAEAIKTRVDLVDASLYMKQLNEYRRYFSDEQILIVWSEDVSRDTDAVVRRCFAFLGVDPDAALSRDDERLNSYDNLLEDRWLLGRMRSIPGFSPFYETMRSSLPRPVKQVVKRVFRRPMPRGRWTAELRDWVVERVQDDVEKFLEHCGKPRDYWDLKQA